MSSSSLLASLSCKDNVHVIIGNDGVAKTRCRQSASAGAHPILVSDLPPDDYDDDGDDGVGEVAGEKSRRRRWKPARDFTPDMLFSLGRHEVNHTVDAVFISLPRDAKVEAMARTCRRNRIPVNVVDSPDLCTFSLLSVYTDGPLQVGVTTNGHGCRLAVRVRRHLASQLPGGLGQAVLRRLILAGSGPGHPSLLTIATVEAIRKADVILADKLVPSPVLDLIPRRTPVQIARKFPGNAQAAQAELLEEALHHVQRGKTVVRLKQGDPYLYGRGADELSWFRDRGLGHRVLVLPGLTSAFAAPLFASVPVTQRDLAHQVLVCTGTGQKGAPTPPPEYVQGRTVVFLMALHRIQSLVDELTASTGEKGKTEEEKSPPQQAPSPPWPPSTPCAVIERASCPDQRIIRTSLSNVVEAVRQEGSRPPGLLVLGAVCEALYTPDPHTPWTVDDGFRQLDDFDALQFQLDHCPDIALMSRSKTFVMLCVAMS
ncbi:hypothetical protein L249_0842 [Ophiocordyceps polyrhachis-furcata BCC 54312]|uniref:Tetrapyrrole methylase domain-containing protein n=1 Tax=Ophiocordyceps polyrhachis-furcata BCC 54312 TaxID=1330021 RepID=A0A367LC36_9HYPO|nr:hypothetical protein L249_0842 [Ophiocordyceps polyrhachis-furcata BCC 54312]